MQRPNRESKAKKEWTKIEKKPTRKTKLCPDMFKGDCKMEEGLHHKRKNVQTCRKNYEDLLHAAQEATSCSITSSFVKQRQGRLPRDGDFFMRACKSGSGRGHERIGTVGANNCKAWFLVVELVRHDLLVAPLLHREHHFKIVFVIAHSRRWARRRCQRPCRSRQGSGL